MSALEVILWSVVAVLGIGASALWSGLETATYVVGRAGLEARASGLTTDRNARTLKLELDKPERVLAGLLILNNTSNYIGVLALARLLELTGLPTWQISVINAAVLTPTLFVFAETLPKEYARITAEHSAYRLAPLLRGIRLLLTALLVLPIVVGAARLMRRLTSGSPDQTPLDPRERMVWLVREAVGQGIVSQTQAELVRRAVALRDTPLRSEMTPWSRVTRLRLDSDAGMARQIASGSPYSRLPVVDRKGSVVGVVSVIDLFLDDAATPEQVMAEALTIDAAVPVRQALRTLRARGQHIAVVTHHARPIGVVTMKDLVEPVTGELLAW
ncbi:MAG: DUF21 domain-containing protein [Phycisphaerales bacterium]|nr:DUF21 domain-containing protein [Phycisphaerales bacterium]MCB9836552.1 DUF21 domain-containing protein [Phycisphaera sp.]